MLRFYNSFSRKKEDFIPLEKGKVKLYTCGPTVYDDAHLGHARTYVCSDIIRRILSNSFNIDTNFIMGMTDVDDKIIKSAKEKNILIERRNHYN